MYVAVVNDRDRGPIHCKAFEEYPEAEEWAQRETSRISRDDYGATWRVLEADVDEPEGKGVVLLDKSVLLKSFSPTADGKDARFFVRCPNSLGVEKTREDIFRSLVISAYDLPEDLSIGLKDHLRIVITIEKGE